MNRATVNRSARFRVTFIWVSGLLMVFAIGILWLGLLGLGVFLIFRAHSRADEVGGYIFLFAFLLFVLGAAFVRFVNRFYEWHSDQNVNYILKELDESRAEEETRAYTEKLVLDFSSEFSDDFKRQLQSSPTFKNTVIEAMDLAKDAAAFRSAKHTDKERDAFRNAWKAKTEKFAQRIAQDDPLAVEVILKAIEKESQKGSES